MITDFEKLTLFAFWRMILATLLASNSNDKHLYSEFTQKKRSGVKAIGML